MARRLSGVRFFAVALLCTALAVLPAQIGRAAVNAGHAHRRHAGVRIAGADGRPADLCWQDGKSSAQERGGNEPAAG